MLSRCSPTHDCTPDCPLPTTLPHRHCPRKCPPPVNRVGEPASSSPLLLPHPCSPWGSKPSRHTLPPPVPMKAKNSMALAQGCKEGQKGLQRRDGFRQQSSPNRQSPRPGIPGCPRHPSDFFMYRRPQASPKPREGRAGQKKDFPSGVCPGSNSQNPLHTDPWSCPAPAPILGPPPQQLEADSGCGPGIMLALLPLAGAGEGVAGQREGDAQGGTAPWWPSPLT